MANIPFNIERPFVDGCEYYGTSAIGNRYRITRRWPAGMRGKPVWQARRIRYSSADAALTIEAPTLKQLAALILDR